MIDWLEKVVPFLAHVPRWLQIAVLAVVAQLLIVSFLTAVYALNYEREKSGLPRLDAQLIDSTPLTTTPAAPAGAQQTAPAPQAAQQATQQSPQPFTLKVALRTRDEFPIAKVTIVNNTDRAQLFERFDVEVVEYSPYAGIPETRVVKPLGFVEVTLPFETRRDRWQLDSPIQIASNDAAQVEFRFMCKHNGEPVPPRDVAHYKVVLVFHAASDLVARTEAFSF